MARGLPPPSPAARPPGRADRPPGWRWRPASAGPKMRHGAADLNLAPGLHAAFRGLLRSGTAPQSPQPPRDGRPASTEAAWAPLPVPEPEPEPEPAMWQPLARRPVHQVRMDLPASARGSHGRRSNESLCKRADIPRDYVHLRARRGTPLATPYFRMSPPSRSRPWAQRPPPVDLSAAAVRRSGIHPGDRVQLKEGLSSLKNGGMTSHPMLLEEAAGGLMGRVKCAGPQYGGDVLVDWGHGRSLWHSPEELQGHGL